MKNENDFFDESSNSKNTNIEEISTPPEVTNTFITSGSIGVEIDNNGVAVNEPIVNNFSEANSSEVENNGSKKKQKKNKRLIIRIVSVLIVVLLVLGGIYFYIKLNFTAEKFIQDNISEFNTWIDKTFADLKNENIKDTQLMDSKSTGKLTFSTNNSELKGLNGLSLEYEIESSIKNEYEMIGLSLKENGLSTISGNFYVEEDNLYIDSTDAYYSVLSYKLEENPFANVDNIDDYEKIFTPENISHALKTITKALGDALLESDVSTSATLTSVQYEYVINASNKEKVANKFITSLKNDDIVMSIISLLNLEDSIENITFEEMSLMIRVNTLSNDIEEFTIVGEDDTKVVGTKIGDNKYKIVEDDSNDYMEIEYSETKFIVTVYEDGKDVGQFSLNSSNDNNITMHFSYDDTKMDMIITSSSDKENSIDLEFTTGDVTITADFTFNVGSDTVESNGKINFEVMGIEIVLNIESSTKYGENLVSKRTFGYTRDVTTLTEEEQNLIYENIYNKLSQLTIMRLFEDIFGSIQDSIVDDTYDDYYSNDL